VSGLTINFKVKLLVSKCEYRRCRRDGLKKLSSLDI
jgi:hypothetical protein